MPRTLLFQGDSITDCGRRGYPAPYLLGPGYPGIIGTKLLGEQPEKEWQIFNRGVSGDRVVDLYARWKIDAINLSPDLISILVGINDTWHEKARQNGVELPRYEEFYRRILSWTLERLPHVKFILLEPFCLPFGAIQPDWPDEVRRRGKIVRQIASDFSAVFVPLQSVFDEALKRAPQEYWLQDGVHPQPAGHQLIANAWLKAADAIL